MKNNKVSKEVMNNIEKWMDIKKRLYDYLARTRWNIFLLKLN